MGNKAIYNKDGSKVIGLLTPEGVYIQKVRQGHLMRWGNAKGIDMATWKLLVGEGCKIWRLELDSGVITELPFKRVADLGIIKTVDAKVGRQIFVGLEFFDEVVAPKRYVE